MAAGPGSPRSHRVAALGARALQLILLTASVVGCAGPSTDDLKATVPTSVSDREPTFKVIDASYMSGSRADGVLAALGKTRADAAVLYADYQVATIIVLRVTGVSGPRLHSVVAEHWVGSLEATRDVYFDLGRQVNRITDAEATYYVFDVHDRVYIAASGSRQTADEVLKAALVAAGA